MFIKTNYPLGLLQASIFRVTMPLNTMSTQKETIEFILEKLGYPKRFTTRAMFGEYALYADSKVVALVCDDQLYVKILPASQALEKLCEKDAPYPGARPHYVIEEDQLSKLDELPDILFAISKSLPAPKKKVKHSK
jgi:TfoX/Sxy family transcriptional regulator of competence genes